MFIVLLLLYAYYMVSLLPHHVLYIIIVLVLLLYLLLPPSFYHSLGHFRRPWVCMPRLEIRVIVASDSPLDSHGRLIIETIHRYPCDLFLLSYLSLFFISVMIANLFCRYSCTYFMLELMCIWSYILY